MAARTVGLATCLSQAMGRQGDRCQRPRVGGSRVARHCKHGPSAPKRSRCSRCPQKPYRRAGTSKGPGRAHLEQQAAMQDDHYQNQDQLNKASQWQHWDDWALAQGMQESERKRQRVYLAVRVKDKDGKLVGEGRLPTAASSSQGLGFELRVEEEEVSETEVGLPVTPADTEQEMTMAADQECEEVATQQYPYRAGAVDTDGEDLVPPEAEDYFQLWQGGLLEDETVASRWGWTMVAQFVRATALQKRAGQDEQQVAEPATVLAAHKEVMLATLRAWKDDLFPGRNTELDEHEILEQAPFPYGELGYSLARFDAWHAGHVREETVLRAGGQPLLRWFQKLAVLRGIKGVHDLQQDPGEVRTGVEAEVVAEKEVEQTLQQGEAGFQGQGSQQDAEEGSTASLAQAASVEAGAGAENAAAGGEERQAAEEAAAPTTSEPAPRAELSV